MSDANHERLLSEGVCPWNEEKEPDCVRVSGPYRSNESLATSETTSEVKSVSKCCQTVEVEAWTNTATGSNYICYESKPLSFIKPKSDSILNTQDCLNKNGSFSQVKASFWNEEKETDCIDGPVPSSCSYKSNGSLAVSETTSKVKNVSKSCQTVEAWINTVAESNCPCNEFKPLSFIKFKSTSRINMQDCLKQKRFFSQVKSSTQKKSNSCDQQSEGLNHLFNDNSQANEFGGSRDKDVESQADVSSGLSRYRESYKCYMQEIIYKLNYLEKCQISLEKQLKSFLSKEFSYEDSQSSQLIHQDHLRLRTDLKKQCKLPEPRELSTSFNSGARHVTGQYGTLSSQLETRGIKDNRKHPKDLSETIPKRLAKNYFYRKAIENSPNESEVCEQVHENKDQEDRLAQNDSKEKLIESIRKLNNKIAGKENGVNKSKLSRIRAKRKIESLVQENIRDLKSNDRSSSKNSKGKKVLNFFLFCPTGFEDSNPVQKTQRICEACKLNSNMM